MDSENSEILGKSFIDFFEAAEETAVRLKL